MQSKIALKHIKESVPLAFISIPEVSMKDINFITGRSFNISREDDILKKNLLSTLCISSNITSTFIPTGTISTSKLLDASFDNGRFPSASSSWTATPSGSWSESNSLGRTSSNSYYSSQDLPAATPNTLYINYSASGVTYKLLSEMVIGKNVSESAYGYQNLAHRLSFYIASDPVKNNTNRISSSNYRMAADTLVNVYVIFYDSSATFLSSSLVRSITWDNPETRVYLNQPTKVFQKCYSDLIYFPSASASAMKVLFEIRNGEGLYFDDVKLSSMVLATPENRYFKTSSITTTRTQPGSSLLNNPNFTSSAYTSGYILDNSGYQYIDIDGEFNAYDLYWNLGNGTVTPRYPENSKSEAPRNGAYFLTLRSASETKGRYVTLPSTGSNYEFSTYEKATGGSALGTISSQLKVTFLDSNYSTLGASTLSPFTSSATYTQRTLTFAASNFPLCVYLKLEVINTANTSSEWHCFDSLTLRRLDTNISNWTFSPGESIGSYTSVPTYVDSYNSIKKSFNSFTFHRTGTTSNTSLYSRRIIRKTGKYTGNYNYFMTELNSEDRAVSDPIVVNLNSDYVLSHVFEWETPVNVEISDDIFVKSKPGSTLKDCFTEPFRGVDLYNDTQGRLYNYYGYVTVLVQGKNSGGTVTETPYSYTFCPSAGNIPEDFIKSSDDLYEKAIASDKFRFTDSTTVSGVVTVKMGRVNLGIKSITLGNLQTATSSSSGVFSNSLHKFNKSIKQKGLVEDPSGAWRPVISDGYIEKEYVIPDNEPSDSWLLSVFSPGDTVNLIYTIPEMGLSQYWDPTKHLKELRDIDCVILDSKSIMLPRKNLYAISSLTINGESIVSTYTPVQSLPNNTYIDSVTPKSGVITLSKSINSNDIIKCTFIYREDDYIYTGYFNKGSWVDLNLNLNYPNKSMISSTNYGISNYELLGKTVCIYLIPSAAYLKTQDSLGVFQYKTITDVPYNKKPQSFIKHKILDINDLSYIKEEPSALLISKIYMNYPYNISNVSLLDIRTRGGGCNEIPLEFTETYKHKITKNGNWFNTRITLMPNDIVTITAEGRVSGSTYYSHSASGVLYGNIDVTTPTTTGFLIGSSEWVRTTVNSTLTSSICPSGTLFLKMSSLEVGDNESLYVTIKIRRLSIRKQRWDITSWDGDPVTINGVVVVDIPKDILTGSNNYTQFSAEEVEEIVNKHVPAGILPIINYI